MLTYLKLAAKPRLFRSFTGLEVEEFNTLFGFVGREYAKCEKKRLGRKDRKRRIGAGRKFNLMLVDRLLMLLVYYRLYATYALVGFLFDIHESNVCRDIKHIEPLVKRCMPLPRKVHQRTKKISTMEELLAYYPELKAAIDATEQEIPRPKNRRRRKSHYSGKKKKHTVKMQITVNRRGLITHKTGHFRGRDHDYSIFKKFGPTIPKDITGELDSGYQGIQDDFPGMKSDIPIKKPIGKKLGCKARKHNRKLGKSRVIVENTISRIKKFRIIGNEFRNRLDGYDKVTDIVCGIVNFRTMLGNGMDVASFVCR